MISKPSFFTVDAVVTPMQATKLLQLLARDVRFSQALQHHDTTKQMKKEKSLLMQNKINYNDQHRETDNISYSELCILWAKTSGVLVEQ